MAEFKQGSTEALHAMKKIEERHSRKIDMDGVSNSGHPNFESKTTILFRRKDGEEKRTLSVTTSQLRRK